MGFLTNVDDSQQKARLLHFGQCLSYSRIRNAGLPSWPQARKLASRLIIRFSLGMSSPSVSRGNTIHLYGQHVYPALSLVLNCFIAPTCVQCFSYLDIRVLHALFWNAVEENCSLPTHSDIPGLTFCANLTARKSINHAFEFWNAFLSLGTCPTILDLSDGPYVNFRSDGRHSRKTYLFELILSHIGSMSLLTYHLFSIR
jgi:hypothetical protein